MSILPQLFGVLPAGSPLVVQPASFDAANGSFTYHVHSNPTHPFSHLSIFLLPGQVDQIPQGKAAAIYISLSGPTFPPESFKFIGGVGHGKESGIFKVSSTQATGGLVAVGISVEDEGSVSQKVAEAKASSATPSPSDALVPSGGAAGGATTLQLAQRIITNAFNNLASHSQQISGVEVIPLKAFQDWWQKFEAKIRRDPGFLERQQD
ncbi:hypothetical protein MKZ38_001165 [Zalerion maritima]|uniref:Hikeshi-like domain-containing protein n=1 Tax=Zalerion maritima TaxID=339359 RepID=A0AAD5WTF2_9PEZI|nr:hypothetical protein MKZ38_001165 [Zalerion maritima]